VRQTNEDSFLIDSEARFFAIADGMGGHANGALASSSVVAWSHRTFLATMGPPLEVLREAMVSSGNELFFSNRGSRQKMGTTLTALYISDAIYYAHVGDCRVYYSSDHRQVLTSDHNLGSSERINGSSMLTKCLGFDLGVSPDLGRIEPVLDFSILMCTDGFYNAVTNDEIFSALENGSPQTFSALKALADGREPEDNYTAIFIGGGPI
jgi:PPM family protein phosphatase